MIRRFVKGRLLDRLPRLPRRRWGPSVQLIVDRSQRLVSFWANQNQGARWVATLFPHHQIEQALVFDEAIRPVIFAGNGAIRDYHLPRAGTLVLVLGDLGWLAGQRR